MVWMTQAVSTMYCPVSFLKMGSQQVAKCKGGEQSTKQEDDICCLRQTARKKEIKMYDKWQIY
jgi:hypothetical protein